MKHILCLVMLLMGIKLSAQASFTQTIPDTTYYQVINTFCAHQHFERISKQPVRYIYEGSWRSETDTLIQITGAQCFLKKVKESDSTKTYFDSSDYVYLEAQINQPLLLLFEPKKIKHTRVKKEQTFIPITNAISIPLFSKDLKSAIITANYWGMSRTYLYHLNPITKVWEMIDQLWQSGS